MSSSLPAQFFCARPSGILTPLIAVDELPAHISIRGVPRVLSPSETQGMTSVGTANPRGQSYTVEGAAPAVARPSTGGTNHRPRNYDLQSSLMRILSDENIPANQRLALNSLLQHGLPQNWHVNNTPAAGWLVPNSGGSPGNSNARQKEYCSYWIRHGECDYQQQGCLYKHEMPHDRAMLEKLGLRDIPRWYREKHGMPSLVNGHGNPRSQPPNGHPWKDEGAFKSIQYPLQLGVNGAGEPAGIEKTAKPKPAAYVPTHQHQQATMFPGASQMAYQYLGSPTAEVHQTQTRKHSPGQFNHGGRKVDLLSFDSPDYTSSSALMYGSSKDNSFEAPGRSHNEVLVRNLQSLALMPVSASADYLPGPFDSTVGSGRSKKMQQRSRRLYQPRSHDPIPDSGPEMADSDPLHVFHNQGAASSSGASVTSKTTGSQLASPMAGPVHGSTTSEPPTRGVSPMQSGTSISSGASPSILHSRGKDKGPRRTPGAIGQKSYRKRSVESSEDDLFFKEK